MPKYSVVIPVFNEEQVIETTYVRLKNVMEKVSEDYELIFINDGSYDKSDILIKEICNKDQRVRLLNLSRNFGQDIAISAGLDHASGDAVIIIDADLQDPPEVILSMIEKWKEGYEVVYGRRLKRKGETFFKEITAKLFYRALEALSDHKIPIDVGDFRLVDKKVCSALRSFKESNRYVRGLVSWVGFKQTYVEYIRNERFSGITKYPYGRMIRLAMDAVTSFSRKPLALASYLGLMMSVLSLISICYVIYLKLFTNRTILGWTSLISVSLLSNGLVLTILGIIGEYVGRIYEETKGRPLYLLKDKIGFKNEVL